MIDATKVPKNKPIEIIHTTINKPLGSKLNLYRVKGSAVELLYSTVDRATVDGGTVAMLISYAVIKNTTGRIIDQEYVANIIVFTRDSAELLLSDIDEKECDDAMIEIMLARAYGVVPTWKDGTPLLPEDVNHCNTKETGS